MARWEASALVLSDENEIRGMVGILEVLADIEFEQIQNFYAERRAVEGVNEESEEVE